MGVNKVAVFSFLFILISFLGVNSYAQIQPETTVHKVEGKKVYLHTVQKGQTLYSISKAYAIEMDEVVKANPGIEKGLTINQIVKIPARKVDKSEMEEQISIVQEGILIHDVQPKETLFSLKTKYGVTVEDLMEVNPELKEGLKIGMKLKIPIPNSDNSEDADQELTTPISYIPASPDSFVSHQVKPKETLYSLAKMYEVNIDTLLTINKGLPNGLKVGSSIRIPKFTEDYLAQKELKKASRQKENQSIQKRRFPLKDTVAVKDTYKIAIMLPFYLDMNDTIEVNKKTFDEPTIYPKATVSLDIYKGILFAIDSLQKTKANYIFKIFDTANDSNKVKQTLSDSSFFGFDVIIGPLYKSNFELVSKAIGPYGIPHISPVPLSNKILLGNPHVSKVVPSLPNHISAITDYVLSKNDSTELILVNSTKSQDKPLFNIAKSKIRAYEIDHYDSLNLDTIKTMRLFEVDTNTLQHYLADSTPYRLIVPSTDQVFVSELLSRIYDMDELDSIEVYGIQPWSKYDNIDIDYLHKLSVHITASEFNSLKDVDCKQFYKSYREAYFTDPSNFSIVGFRTVYFLLKSLDLYGLNFPKRYDELYNLYPDLGFKFFKTGVESGYENKFVYVLKYDNFELKEVWK